VNDLCLRFKLRVKVGDYEIVSKPLQSLIASTNKSNAAVSGAPTCCFPSHGDVSFISRPSQKFLSDDNSGVLQYNLSLSAVSAIALNE